MTAEEKPFYTIACDHAGGCSAEVDADGMSMVYSSAGEAREEAYNADWAVDIDGKDYCFAHWKWVDDDDGGHRVPLTAEVRDA